MKNKNKKNIYLIILIVILVVACIVLKVVQNSNSKKNSKKETTITDDISYKWLSITDVNPYSTDTLNHITMYVKNDSKNDFKSEKVRFVFYSDKGKKMYDEVSVLPDIKKGKMVSIDLIVDKKTLSATRFEIKECKK